MVYTTDLWWFGGFFIVGFTTLHQITKCFKINCESHDVAEQSGTWQKETWNKNNTTIKISKNVGKWMLSPAHTFLPSEPTTHSTTLQLTSHSWTNSVDLGESSGITSTFSKSQRIKSQQDSLKLHTRPLEGVPMLSALIKQATSINPSMLMAGDILPLR